MFWKKENEEIAKKLKLINENIKNSFANVKRDTAGIFQWLNYFYRKSLEQDQKIRQLQEELSYMPKTKEEIRRIIDDYYSFGNIISKIRELSSKVDELSKVQTAPERHVHPIYHELLLKLKELDSKINDISTRQFGEERHLPRDINVGLIEIQHRLDRLEQRKMSMKEKIIKRLTRNSKEYVKSMILSYIRKYERISALQLKEIIVDEQNFCSKSSFYRLLEEIEDSDDVGVIKQGKEKHYISKVIKRV